MKSDNAVDSIFNIRRINFPNYFIVWQDIRLYLMSCPHLWQRGKKSKRRNFGVNCFFILGDVFLSKEIIIKMFKQKRENSFFFNISVLDLHKILDTT